MELSGTDGPIGWNAGGCEDCGARSWAGSGALGGCCGDEFMMGGAGVMVWKIVVVGRGLGRLKVLAKVEGIDWGRVEIFSSSHLEDSVDVLGRTPWGPGVPVPGFGSAAPCHDDYALMWRSWPFTSPLG